MRRKNKILKFCFYYYSFAVFISAVYFIAPKMNKYNILEIARETTPVQKQINKPLSFKK